MMYGVKECEKVESIQEVLTSLVSVVSRAECSEMPEDVLSEYRKALSKVQGTAKKGLSKTSRKDLNFDEKEISNYIDFVLQRGFSLVETNPVDAPKLNDAQNIKRYGDLIKERVQASAFCEDQFNIGALSVQRRDIEASKSLHDLRQSIKAMIPVLRLYREYEVLRADSKKNMDYTNNWVSVQEHDQVLLELEAVQKLSDTRKYTIDAIIDGLYQPAADMSDEELLQAVDAFKAMHQCSDDEAAKFYGTNRTKISRLRSKANRQPH